MMILYFRLSGKFAETEQFDILKKFDVAPRRVKLVVHREKERERERTVLVKTMIDLNG